MNLVGKKGNDHWYVGPGGEIKSCEFVLSSLNIPEISYLLSVSFFKNIIKNPY